MPKQTLSEMLWDKVGGISYEDSGIPTWELDSLVDDIRKHFKEIVPRKLEYPKHKYDWVDVGEDIGFNQAIDQIHKAIEELR